MRPPQNSKNQAYEKNTPARDSKDEKSYASKSRHSKSKDSKITPLVNMNGIYSRYRDNQLQYFTNSINRGKSVYGELLLPMGNKEFRNWDCTRSKLGAALSKGLASCPIKEGSYVLYLGAANGTTVSHISDIVGSSGLIYAVEISDHPFIDLLRLSSQRSNIIPIIADARSTNEYVSQVGAVDVIYADIAQSDQTDIVIQNALRFLRPKGWLILVLKLSSIAYVTDYNLVFQQEKAKILPYFSIVQELDLIPYHQKHRFLVCRFL